MSTLDRQVNSKRSDRAAQLKVIGDRIADARIGQRLSMQELGQRIGISEQQVRRIERGTSETGAYTLGQIAGVLAKPVGYFIPQVRSLEQHANYLWHKHGLHKKLEGSASADFIGKQSILQAMKLWEPPTASFAAADTTMFPGFEGTLPNKAALAEVLAGLPEGTQWVRMLAISGTHTWEPPKHALQRLGELHQKKTCVEFLFLSPQSRFITVRERESKVRDAEDLRNRITASIKLIQRLPGKTPSIYLYDAPPIWRLTFVDDVVYAAHYPPDREGSTTPVAKYRADRDRESPYWALLQQYLDYRRRAKRVAGEKAGSVQDVYDEITAEVDKLDQLVRRR